MRGTNLKSQKTKFSELRLCARGGREGGATGMKSRNTKKKTHMWHTYQVCIPNFNLLAQFETEIGEEQPFFKVKKEGPYLLS